MSGKVLEFPEHFRLLARVRFLRDPIYRQWATEDLQDAVIRRRRVSPTWTKGSRDISQALVRRWRVNNGWTRKALA